MYGSQPSLEMSDVYLLYWSSRSVEITHFVMFNPVSFTMPRLRLHTTHLSTPHSLPQNTGTPTINKAHPFIHGTSLFWLLLLPVLTSALPPVGILVLPFQLESESSFSPIMCTFLGTPLCWPQGFLASWLLFILLSLNHFWGLSVSLPLSNYPVFFKGVKERTNYKPELGLWPFSTMMSFSREFIHGAKWYLLGASGQATLKVTSHCLCSVYPSNWNMVTRLSSWFWSLLVSKFHSPSALWILVNIFICVSLAMRRTVEESSISYLWRKWQQEKQNGNHRESALWDQSHTIQITSALPHTCSSTQFSQFASHTITLGQISYFCQEMVNRHLSFPWLKQS